MAKISKRARQILADSKRDNELLKTGKISEKTFWNRVHARDAELKANPTLRREVNG